MKKIHKHAQVAYSGNAEPFIYTYDNDSNKEIETTLNIGRVTFLGNILATCGATRPATRLPWWAKIFKVTSPFIYNALLQIPGAKYGAFGAFPESLMINSADGTCEFKTNFGAHVSPFQQQTGMIDIKIRRDHQFNPEANTILHFTQRPYTILTLYIYPATIITTAPLQPTTTNP